MKEEIIDIIKRAIDIEEFGTYYYNKLKESVEDGNGKALLAYLANAEVEHKQHLSKILSQFGGQVRETEIDTLISSILMDEGEESLFRDIVGKPKLEKMDAMEATRLGLSVESKSIKFYSDNAKKTSQEDLKVLFTELADWEKEHFELLTNNLRTLKDEGSWYGYVPILEG